MSGLTSLTSEGNSPLWNESIEAICSREGAVSQMLGDPDRSQSLIFLETHLCKIDFCKTFGSSKKGMLYMNLEGKWSLTTTLMGLGYA